MNDYQKDILAKSIVSNGFGFVMQVFVSIHGTLKEYFLADQMQITLKDKATLQDLLIQLEAYIDASRGQPYWNFETKTFRGPVLTSIDGSVTWDTSKQLQNNQQITIKRLLIGG